MSNMPQPTFFLSIGIGLLWPWLLRRYCPVMPLSCQLPCRYIAMLAVDKNMRKRRIGSTLVEKVAPYWPGMLCWGSCVLLCVVSCMC